MNVPESKCGHELVRLDHAVSFLGPQHPICGTKVANKTFPHHCATCHAVLAGGRCTATLEGIKGLYCDAHKTLAH